MTKFCPDCKEDKPYSEFFKSKNGSKGLAAYCKPCHNNRGKKARGTFGLVKEVLPDGYKRCGLCDEVKLVSEFYTYSDAVREATRRGQYKSMCKGCEKRKTVNSGYFSKYGITLDQRNAMLLEQNYLCCICQADLRQVSNHTDHCHISGKVRGILCHSCNVGLGHFRDNPQLCALASEYLLKHTSP
jgi:recombination endonuclease VII